MYYRKADKKRRRQLLAFRLLTIGLTLVLIIFLIDRKFRPIIRDNAALQAKIIATTALNDAVTNQLANLDTSYNQLATLQKNKEDRIISLETNTAAINKIQAGLTACVMEKLKELEQADFSMSLGTLIDADYFAGRGPSLRFHLQPGGYVTTKIVSNFTDAGINQTHHEIIFEVSVTIAAAIPGYSSSADIKTNFILADTIIVGEIPEYYTNVITEDRNLINDINDYSLNEIK